MSCSKVKTNGRGSTKKGLFAIGLAIAMVVGAFGLSFGNSGYYNAFGTQYGTAVTNAFGCGVCHTSPPTLNPYGNDFFNSNFNFSAIEALDSDGDAFTNIVEINAVTNPGSAASHPVVVIDATPPVVTGLVIPSSSSSAHRCHHEPHRNGRHGRDGLHGHHHLDSPRSLGHRLERRCSGESRFLLRRRQDPRRLG